MIIQCHLCDWAYYSQLMQVGLREKERHMKKCEAKQ